MNVPARRAVARWGLRLFRREWRQQLLVLLLLTFVVAAAVFIATASYNGVSSPESEFGTANARAGFDEPDAAQRAAAIATYERWFGPVEVIGHDAVRVPGSVDTIDLRSQRPDGRFSAPMLALRDGKYPTRADEVALTEQVARDLDTGIGRKVTLGRIPRAVVGIVENPRDFSDNFALVAPQYAARDASVTVLLDASEAERTAAPGGSLPAPLDRPWSSDRTTAAAIIFALSTVALLLVCLVAAAGFVVVAQRRLRQLGLLASIGATDRHLRLVMLVNGLAIGAVAAIAGATLGVAAWFVAAPHLEPMVGMRLDGWDVPLWLVVTGMLLALLTATAASAWPARAVARIPVVQALSARPAAPRPARRSLVAAVVCFGAGFAALAFGNNVAKDQGNPLLVVAGIVALVAGIVVISPLALRAIGAAASRFPVAPRLALRDLGRYQTRAGAALAAISLGLSLSIAIVVIASANEAAAGAGNLSNRQLLIRMRTGSSVLPETSAADVDHLDGGIARLASSLGHATVLPLDVAVDRNERDVGSDGTAVHPMGMLAVQVGRSTFRDAGALYVATPATLRALGIRSGTVAPSVELVTPHRGDVYIANVRTADRGPVPARATQHVDAPRYSGMPQHLLTASGLQKYGLTPSRAAWFLEAANPLTAHQRAAARDFAAALGLSVESRDTNAGLRSLRTGATVAGVGLALAILAMTIGLIRSEGGRDLRTLIATGASRATRRAVTAATAGALALAGFVLGVAAAYIALLAGYLHDLSRLGQVPLASLAIMAIGLPLLAAAGGWLLGGGERDAIARQVLD